MQALALSKDTLEILKNMSAINNSLKFEEGSVLKTVSPAGSVIMEATVAETFPITFSIYELNKFLNVLNLPTMKDAELMFEDDKKVVIKAGKTKINYFFANEGFVQHPGKTVVLPTVDLDVIVTEQDLDGFTRAAAALGHKILEFRAEGGNAFLVASTPEMDTSNDYVVELCDTEAEDGSYRIKAENFRVLNGDYHIQVCAKGIMRVQHQTRPIACFFGLERTA